MKYVVLFSCRGKKFPIMGTGTENFYLIIPRIYVNVFKLIF